jgi:hypothetical protein
MNKIEKRPVSIGGKLLKIIACLVFFVVFSVFQSHLAFAAEGVPTVTISVNDKGETIILSDGEILDVSAGDGWRTFKLSPGVTIKAFILFSKGRQPQFHREKSLRRRHPYLLRLRRRLRPNHQLRRHRLHHVVRLSHQSLHPSNLTVHVRDKWYWSLIKLA